ncbi:hypothetical protein [Paucihalobacter sp.]|uniref:hypothetical protein n=1 Tax=Paucihalobacter sp. TaxID=2850405 RepID=UPI002FE41D64
MKPLHTNTYKQIGYLFYAVAAVDKNVAEAEVETLKKLVKQHWLPLDETNDIYGSDAAHQIEIVFDWLNDNEQAAKACYNKFEDYYKTHNSVFTAPVKKLILDTAEAIANSFSGKNKSELMLLAKLSVLFKEH